MGVGGGGGVIIIISYHIDGIELNVQVDLAYPYGHMLWMAAYYL